VEYHQTSSVLKECFSLRKYKKIQG